MLLLPLSSFAQEVRGTIRNIKSQGVPDAAISLIRLQDSTIARSTLSKTYGIYQLKAAAGAYSLEVSASGYETQREQIQLSADEILQKDFSLQIKSTSLENVTVQAKKPYIEAKPGMMVVNVENSATAAGSNALELLQRSPGVRVDADGTVSMRGNSGVQIYVDGRPSRLAGDQLLAYLKSMTAEEIAKIELITQASAKYDAAGTAGIINIRTRSIKKAGINVQLAGTATMATWFNGNLSGRITYQKNKLTLYASEYFNYVNNLNTLQVSRKFFNEYQEPSALMETSQRIEWQSRFHRIKAGGEYAIDDKTTIGLRAQFPFGNPVVSYENASTLTDYVAGTKRYTAGARAMENHWNEREIGVLGRHTFANEGQLSLDAFAVDNQGGDQGIFTNREWTDNGGPVTDDSWKMAFPVYLRLISSQLDYEKSIGKSTKLETGMKYQNVAVDNRSEFMIQNAQGDFINDTSRSNHFLYNEQIAAGYASVSRSFGTKWETQAGLRAEHTTTQGELPDNGISFNRNYLSLFPTLFASYKPDSIWTVTMSYGRRLDRPNYYMLNPARNYIDKYTYRVGNPLLRPQFVNNIELGGSWKGALTATLSFMQADGIIADFFVQNDSEKTAFEIHDNIPGYYQAGISVNYNKQITKLWTTNLYADFYHRQYHGSYFGQIYDQRGQTYSANMNNQFRLKHGWTAELTGWFDGPGLTGLFTQSAAMGSVDVAISKKMCSDSLVVKLAMNDVFGTQKYHGSNVYSNFDTQVYSTWDARRAVFSLNYSFGKKIETMARRSDAESKNM
jgi:outer membrane receptor protein involved in Fe transport